MALPIGKFVEHLADPEAASARVTVCDAMAECLSSAGNVLWSFGLATGERRAVATAVQLAAATGSGTVSLLRGENWYASAALIRQLVEHEYLLCLFALHTEEPVAWMQADSATLRREYMPARMRERCGDRFRAHEYSIHCEIGGHPRYQASFLLPERVLPGDKHPVGSQNWLWLDLAQHLESIWVWVGACLNQYRLLGVLAAAQAYSQVQNALVVWRAADPCSSGLAEVEAKLHAGSQSPTKH